MKTLLTVIVVTAICLPTVAAAQAVVNESLESAYLYVDPSGSDTNPGTQTQPLKTVNAAVKIALANNAASIGTHVTINPGTYREQVTISCTKTFLPITFQAATTGTAIVSGGSLYTNWTVDPANSARYTHSWTYTWGYCSPLASCVTPQNIVRRKEMVVVNGVSLAQVLALSSMQQGTFYVDETGGLIYVWPATGTDMSSATVEVATRSTLWSVKNASNIVTRGLVFQYSNSCHSAAAVEASGKSSNLIFDSDTFQWNNGQGLKLSNPVTQVTVQNSSGLHNGDSGFTASDTQNVLYQSDTASYNNWRGSMGAYYACNMSGLHTFGTHGDTVDGLVSTFNQTYGTHSDTGGVDLNISNSTYANNLLSGLYFDKAEGPVTVSNSVICNQTSNLSTGGFQLRNSWNIALSNNSIMNNAAAQIRFLGTRGGLVVTDWVTGIAYNLISQNLTLTNNIIEGTDSTQMVFEDSYLYGADWTDFQTTFSASGNAWWNPANSNAFILPSPAANSVYDFTGWQTQTGQDGGSNWSAPPVSPPACSLVPIPDFWLTVDNGALTVNAGRSATFHYTVTMLNSTAAVTLSVDGVGEVPGLSSSWSGNALTISSTASTAPGTYPITVLGLQNGITHPVTVLLTIAKAK
jgi:hypothetical protein